MLDRPIIVTGCARSGTSMVAGVLALCGAWVGRVTGATPWNKKGQYENEVIRDHITKPYLRKIGADPLGQQPLPDLKDVAFLAQRDWVEWQVKVIGVLDQQGYPGDIPWMFKGAKACLIWPLWARAFPNASWIIVRREDTAVIDSCMKTSFMRKRQSREEWQDWIDHHKLCFADIMANCKGVQQVWPGKMLSSPRPWKLLVEGYGLKFNEELVGDFLDTKLWSGG